MSRWRTFSIFMALLIATIAAIAGIRGIEKRLDDTIETEELRFTGTVKDAPPAVAFTSMALGSFRGLLADILWLRSETMKSKKNYFELVQLARRITDLQPNYSGGTAYLAWNLAYNISVTSSDPEERWYWVNEGIKLIRDKALIYNPNDPKLYHELSWIYLHKMGNVLDDAHLYYKNQLAMEMMTIFGAEQPDWEHLASAPATEAEFMKKYPADHRIWQAIRAAGYKSYQALYDAFRKPIPADLPQEVKAKLTVEDAAAISAAFRARMLRDKLRLDPARMAKLNREYGEMDWRVPESLAIYWATIGLEKSNGKYVHCRRDITQALQSAFRSGRLLVIDTGKGAYLQFIPNYKLASAAYDAFVEAQQYESGGSAESFRSARINFLKDAIPLLYLNEPREAEKYFQKLIEEDGPQKQNNVVEFVMKEFAEDVRDGDVEKASAIISECIYRSLDKLVAGERKDAVDYNRLAEYIHRKYLAENKDIKRNNLPPFKQMRDSMIDYCKRMWPREKVAILNMWLNVEKMEQEKEQKEAKGM